jgi:anti-sigma factor RsiW
MTCRDVEQILPGYVDNALSEGERRDVQEHLAQCPQCRLALADLERSLALARHSDRVTPPAWLKGRVMARVKAEAGP